MGTEIYNRKKTLNDEQTSTHETDALNANRSYNRKPEPPSKIKEEGFGGMKKGFLSSSNTKSAKPEKRDNGAVPKSSANSNRKSNESVKDKPVLKKKTAVEDVPPLEDMSEVQEQVKAFREPKEKQEQKKADELKPVKTGKVATEINNHKINTRKTDTLDTNSSLKRESEPPKRTNVGSFGGMKKGFLFSSNTKTKPSRQEKKENGVATKLPANSDQISKATEGDIPFIEKKDANESEHFKLPEVQGTMNKTSEKLLKNQDWVTDDLLSKLETNQAVMKGFQNPVYTNIIGEFQRDPQGAMEKYKDHKEFQEFFREFCKLIGDHFGCLGSEESTQPSGQMNNSASSTPKISVVPDSESAEMTVRSSTNPRQPTAEDEQKMQKILSDPEIRTILSDPKIAEQQGIIQKQLKG